jgi:glycerophosphoryl diester phosphodiesterase
VTLVIAHRGASWELPENTLHAFARAIELGADYVELDVHAARDGTLVVTHDPPSDKVSLGGDGVPLLQQVLDLCRGRIGIMIELKSPYRYRRHGVIPRTLALLEPDEVVISFSRRALEEVRRRRPELRTVQHVGYGVTLRGAAGAWAVGFENGRVTPRAIARAQRLGFATTVYTVNDETRMRELERLGVTGIFTDRPELALRTLAAPRG